MIYFALIIILFFLAGKFLDRIFILSFIITVVMFGFFLFVNHPKYSGFVVDKDNNVYATVKVGKQEWMAENYRLNVSEKSFCYDDDERNCESYGRLYTWNAIMKYPYRGICPIGWHVPENIDYYLLFSTVGGYRTAGYALRSVEGWFSASNIFDEYDFSVRGAGYKDSIFQNLGKQSCLWTSSEYNDDYAAIQCLTLNETSVEQYLFYKENAASLRCVKDYEDDEDDDSEPGTIKSTINYFYIHVLKIIAKSPALADFLFSKIFFIN